MSKLPQGWKKTTIGDNIKFSGGAQPPRNTFLFEEKEEYIRLIQIRDYKSDKFKTFVPKNLARKFCFKEDIMIGRYGPPIFQILRGLEGAYNVALIKAIPEENVDKEFVYYTLLQEKLFKLIDNLSQRSSGQTGIDMEQLKAFSMPLPPLEEQKKIADILSTVDKKIAFVEENITTTQELKKGLMQKLLTQGLGHTEFKDSELGMIPEGWEVKEVGKHIKLMGGYAFKSQDSTEQGVKWLKIANVGIQEIKWEQNSYLPIDFIENYSKFLLQPNDIVLAMTRPILNNKLKIAKINDNDLPALLNQRVGKFIFDSKVYSEFMYYLFQHIDFVKILMLKILGTDPPNVGSEQIESINIVFPPFEEQKQIAEILSTVDKKLEILKEKKATFTELKKGLMQKLLTGEVRI